MSFTYVKSVVEENLLATPGVVGVGGTAEKIRVYVEGSPELDHLPRSIAGYNVEVVKAGHVKALAMVQEMMMPLETERTMRVRPAPGGVSIGHYSITAGTLATAIRIGGIVYGLSNNHVLAAGSTLQNPNVRVGDLILQPGKYDGGSIPNDVIGTLERWVPLDEVGYNLVDCALFRPTSPGMLSSNILGLAPFTGFKAAQVGMELTKSGRTSGVNVGKVQDLDATMVVDYGSFKATFHHQIVTDVMAQPGDSGSLTMESGSYAATGLVYAGSDYITMHNHIRDVLNALSVGVGVVGVPSVLGLMSVPFGMVLTSLV